VESFSYSDHFMVKFELSINCHEYKGLARSYGSYVYDYMILINVIQLLLLNLC